MKTIRIIEELVQETPISIEYIESGLTNHNYIVKLKDRTVVVRLPKPENAHLFNYALEDRILKNVVSLDTPLVYFDAESGVKVSSFIDDATTFEIQYLKRAAKLVRTLHSLSYRSGHTYNIKSSFNLYYCKKPLFNLNPYLHYLEEAHELSNNLVLSHNDLVQGNFLFGEKRDYLIDYEYACDNDPFFDLSSFITENDIQDESQRQSFLESYFQRSMTPDEITKFHIFECALYVLWCQWACMMYEVHHDVVYKEIAKLKHTRLMERMQP